MARKEKSQYKVKRNKYITITMIIVIVFFAFQIVYNFDYFVHMAFAERAESMVDAELAREYVFGGNTVGQGGAEEPTTPDESKQTADFCVISDMQYEAEMTICMQVLDGQKRDYIQAKDVTSLETLAPQVVLILKADLNEEETACLLRLVENGTQVIFLAMPDEASLRSEALCSLLGIYETTGQSVHTGIRFMTDFFVTDELIESHDIEIKMQDCILAQKTVTYAYSLATEWDTEVDNEELPPAIWKKNYLQSNVYVVNGNFVELGCFPGIVTALISMTQEDDIYPVINGYGVMIQGMPYIKTTNGSHMEQLYSRDAMGLQQDILFPALISSVRKHYYLPTFFCSVAGYERKPDEYIQKQIAYMEKEITAASGEIGLLYEGDVPVDDAESPIAYGTALYDSGSHEMDAKIYTAFPTIVKEDLTFGTMINEKTQTVYVPVVRSDVFEEERGRLAEISSVTANGLLTVLIDVDAVLQGSAEQYNWVQYTKQCETVLGAHNEYYADLTRLSASQIAERILAYEAMEPQVQKEENEIRIHIDRYTGYGCFVLRTEKEVTDVQNGVAIEIGDSAYFVVAQDADVKIILEKEKDVF